MKLYFRADTRPPEEIFYLGFYNKLANISKFDWWWRSGLQFTSNDAPLKEASEADTNNVVSLSKKLEATPAFPVCDQFHAQFNSEVYIYVMVLPEAKLPDGMKRDQSIDVFDLQAHQVKQVKEILAGKKDSLNPAIVGYVLSGHEVYVQNVESEKIICAVKCKRSDFAHTAGMSVFSRVKDDELPFLINLQRKFVIGDEIFLNPKHVLPPIYEKIAIEQLRKAHAKGTQCSTSVEEALTECGIPYDKTHLHTSTYLWMTLSSFQFVMAFLCILESLYFQAIQLTKFSRQPKQEEMEIIPVYDTERVRAKKNTLSFYGRYFCTVGLLTGEADPVQAFMLRK